MALKTCEKFVKSKVTSPLGPISFVVCENGLHKLGFSKDVSNENYLHLGVKSVDFIDPKEEKHEQVDRVQEWLKNYFMNKKEIEIDICPKVASKDSEKFRHRVWITLKNQVKFGQTISYGQLAKLVGKPGASQAVGSAMSNNDIGLVIPCHRVIKSSGAAGNYAKGSKNDIKAWLLEFEKS